MVFKDASNLPANLRKLNTIAGRNNVAQLGRIPENTELEVIRRAKDTVTGMIAAADLPDTRSVRRALTKDAFCLQRLVFLHQLFNRSDLAMQAFPLFGNYEGGEQRVYPLNDTLLQLKEFYTGAEILRFLRRRRRRLAMQQDRIQFFLPDCSKVLYDAGKTLHNCVGTYAQRVRNGETHIVLMSDDRGKLVACIEVTDGAIKQAKLDCNQPVHKKPEVNAEIIAWAAQVGITYDHCADIDARTQMTETAIAMTA